MVANPAPGGGADAGGTRGGPDNPPLTLDRVDPIRGVRGWASSSHARRAGLLQSSHSTRRVRCDTSDKRRPFGSIRRKAALSRMLQSVRDTSLSSWKRSSDLSRLGRSIVAQRAHERRRLRRWTSTDLAYAATPDRRGEATNCSWGDKQRRLCDVAPPLGPVPLQDRSLGQRRAGAGGVCRLLRFAIVAAVWTFVANSSTRFSISCSRGRASSPLCQTIISSVRAPARPIEVT